MSDDSFRLLDLPAELRNMVYSYVVGKHSDRERLVLNAKVIQSAEGRHRNLPPCLTALLLVNRQVSNEALDVLYTQNTFMVVLNIYQTKSAQDKSPAFLTERAIPYNWQMSRIAHLCVGIGLEQEVRDMASIVKACEWDMLPLMTSLVTVRFFIATVSDRVRTVAPVPHIVIDGGGLLPKGTVWYRSLVRNFLAALKEDAKLLAGLDKEEDRLKLYHPDPERPMWYGFHGLPGDLLPSFVPSAFLEKTFVEFEGLRGVDVECYMEDPNK